MEQVREIFRKFSKNKNLITILGIILILVLLYIGYSHQINTAVNPVSVPVAATNIQPKTHITQDMIKTVDMPSISISENVIRNSNQVVGKYSNINSVIPEGSMFYKDTVVEQSELPDSVFIKVKAGEVLTSFAVNMETTYGNSIMPGNYVDIYMKVGSGSNDNSKIMVGQLIENAEVLAVKDSSGKNVFENTTETRTPAYLMFGFKEEIYQLLLKASYMKTLGVELFPVIHGQKVSTGGATEVSTQQLVDYINAHSVDIPIADTSVTKTDELVPTIKQNETLPTQVTITYPEGCGSTYTCTYKKDGGKAVKVTSTSQLITFSANGTLSATVKDADGNSHKSGTITINIQPNNTTTQTAGQ